MTYTGSADVEPVQLYAAAISGDLAYLDLTITMGQHASGPSSSCAGFTPAGTLFSGTLADFAAAHSSYATGRSTWDPADAEETRGFRFSLSVQDDPGPPAGPRRSASRGGRRPRDAAPAGSTRPLAALGVAAPSPSP